MKQRMIKGLSLLFGVRGGLLVTILGGFAWGCITHTRYDRVLNGSQTLVYQINSTGTTRQSAFFKPDDLVRELSSKGEALNTVIKRFTLRSLEIKATLNSTNKAIAFTVKKITIKGANNIILFSDRELPFSSIPAGGLELLVNGQLDADKVGQLNQIVSNQFVNRGPKNYIPIEFELEGTNVPTTALASLTLALILDANIEYTTCEEVLYPLFGIEKECL